MQIYKSLSGAQAVGSSVGNRIISTPGAESQSGVLMGASTGVLYAYAQQV